MYLSNISICEKLGWLKVWRGLRGREGKGKGKGRKKNVVAFKMNNSVIIRSLNGRFWNECRFELESVLVHCLIFGGKGECYLALHREKVREGRKGERVKIWIKSNLKTLFFLKKLMTNIVKTHKKRKKKISKHSRHRTKKIVFRKLEIFCTKSPKP